MGRVILLCRLVGRIPGSFGDTATRFGFAVGFPLAPVRLPACPIPRRRRLSSLVRLERTRRRAEPGLRFGCWAAFPPPWDGFGVRFGASQGGLSLSTGRLPWDSDHLAWGVRVRGAACLGPKANRTADDDRRRESVNSCHGGHVRTNEHGKLSLCTASPPCKAEFHHVYLVKHHRRPRRSRPETG